MHGSTKLKKIKLSKIFGSKRDEINRQRRRLFNEVLYNLYPSQTFSGRSNQEKGRSRWPRGLRCRSAASRLLRLWVRIPPGGMDVCFEVVCYQVEVTATSWSLVQRVLVAVMRRCVWSRNLANEETMVHWGLLRPKRNKSRKIRRRGTWHVRVRGKLNRPTWFLVGKH